MYASTVAMHFPLGDEPKVRYGLTGVALYCDTFYMSMTIDEAKTLALALLAAAAEGDWERQKEKAEQAEQDRLAAEADSFDEEE